MKRLRPLRRADSLEDFVDPSFVPRPRLSHEESTQQHSLQESVKAAVDKAINEDPSPFLAPGRIESWSLEASQVGMPEFSNG